MHKPNTFIVNYFYCDDQCSWLAKTFLDREDVISLLAILGYFFLNIQQLSVYSFVGEKVVGKGYPEAIGPPKIMIIPK